MKALLFFLLAALPLCAEVKKDISYREVSENTYQKERCKLDLYLPSEQNYPTLVWLHGGGLKGGRKDGPKDVALAQRFSQEGIAVAMVNYRLHPEAVYPTYVEDTAAAVAWVLQNIAQHGGDAKKVFLGGHSAGGTLTLLVGMDPRWLAAHSIERDQLVGLIPVSAQTMTHYTIRKERFGSDDPFLITADDASPVRYANQKGIPPTHFIWADKDAPARAEENAYLAAVMKGAGHQAITTEVISKRNHSSVAHKMGEANDPGAQSLLNFLRRLLKEQE